MNIVQVIKSSPLFNGWKDADLQRLAGAVTQRSLSAGESLFVEGEDSTAFYIVASGTVSIRKMSGGDEQAVTNIGPGSHFGEMAMLAASGATEKRSAGAEATESSQVVEISFAAFEKLVTETPALGLLFYKNLGITLAARIRRTTEDLAGLRSLRLRNV